MSLILRKIIFTLSFNSCLFLFLIIGIQNSTNKSNINFLINESVKLPLSFIIGTSFISGSIIGSITNIGFTRKN